MVMCSRSRPVWLLAVSLLSTACFNVKAEDTDSRDAGFMPSGAGVGESCRNLADCRSGLKCAAESKTCQPAGNKVPEALCLLSAECMPDYYCTPTGRCAAAGTGAENDECASDGECAGGLMCALSGLAGRCTEPGVNDLGGSCAQMSDCMAGLLCVSGTCQKGILLVPWSGAVCSPESGKPRVLFEVPRAAAPASQDFYRLPFPNDIRKKNGRISLAGHPRPGASILPFDLVDRYLKAVEEDSTGFGTNQAVYLRFSHDMDLGSLNGAVDIIDITPGSPEYGMSMGFDWNASNGRTNYLCDHYMIVRAPWGRPLRPGTTYVVVVKGGAKDETGVPLVPDDDFAAMLAAQQPTDPDLAAAWTAYAPLRAYLADASAGIKLSAAELAVAVVFTTEKVEDPLAAIDKAVQAAPAPAISKLVRCGDPGVVSPCDDGKSGAEHERGCVAEDLAGANFDEYQGTISLPVFQAGKAPYELPEDGGAIEIDASGTAKIQPRTEQVCFSLTVPKGAPPANGWPLVVYSHGTGGSYRSTVLLGLAADYAKGEAEGGAATPAATLSYEGALHGTRKGDSRKPVTELVYNFLNPRAARDNALQAAADLLAIPRAIDNLAAGGIKLDKTKLALYGHSQGGNAASLAASREAGYGAVVMSGTGGVLIHTLLGKEKPVNVAAVLPFLLGEMRVDAAHPVLNLMQMYFERSDTVNFARRLVHEPHPSKQPQHVLHVYGTKDTYSVVETQRLFMLAGNFALASPVVDPYFADANAFPPVAPPIKANRPFGRVGAITAAMIQYAPSDYDGHFVSTRNAAARTAIQRFLVSFIRDDAPTISP